MKIDEILKRATALKKSNGFSFALDFLINCYNEINSEDLPRLFDKIYTYFSKDINNPKVRGFFSELINSKRIEQYSGLLSSYYWMLHDYESYKLTLMNQISKVNPNNPWQYCYDLKQLQFSLSGYYNVKGLNEEDNAIEYLYNLISSTFFDVAGELMMYDYNFNEYYFHLHFGKEVKFYHSDRLIPLSEFIERWFENDSNSGSLCLKTLRCSIPLKQVTKLIKQKIFYDLPKQLGFNIDILNRKYDDISSFALSYFNEEDYKDILVLSDKIKDWKIQIAGKTVGIAADETNNILKQLHNN